MRCHTTMSVQHNNLLSAPDYRRQVQMSGFSKVQMSALVGLSGSLFWPLWALEIANASTSQGDNEHARPGSAQVHTGGSRWRSVSTHGCATSGDHESSGTASGPALPLRGPCRARIPSV